MTELDMLRVLLVVSVAVAPLSTRLLDPRPRGWLFAYALGLASVALSLFSPMPWLSLLWLLFCLGNFAAFAMRHGPTLRTPVGLARSVPFVFSLVAATWLVGGANDLRILGYGPHFSYYAALHGNVLGWTLVGAIAVLAARERPHQRLYLAAVFVCFVSFLLVALGIDRLAALKPIGAVGLSVTLPLAQLAFLTETWRTHRAAFAACLVSLVGLAFTMVLAWQNHLAAPSLAAIGGVRPMVSVHGVVNGVIVGPAFLLAVALSARPRPAR